MSYVLSIDIGTTTVKAALVSADGKIVNQSITESPVERPEEGAVEHNPALLIERLIDVCGKAVQGHASRVKVIVPNSYQFGLVLLDPSGKVIHGISTLLDTRVCKSWAKFQAAFDAGEVYEQTGCPSFIQYPLARLFHLKNDKPDLFARIGRILSSKDFITLSFCGELLAETSTNAASQFLNVKTLEWSDLILKKLSLTADQFPVTCDGGSTMPMIRREIAESIGLPAPVPFLLGVYDGGALGVGLSGLAESVGIINLGTSGMLRIPWKAPLLDDTKKMRFQTYHLTGDTYFVGSAINNGTVILRWLKDLFGCDYEAISEAALSAPAGANGVTFLPYLTGERDWKVGDVLSGVVHGLREHHGRSELCRAAMEGVCFSLYLIKEALAENKMLPKELRMGGGGLRVSFWPQMFADVFAQPIRLAPVEEPALLGNAILGFTALREFRTLQEAASAMITPGEVIEPDMTQVPAYRELLARFKQLRSNAVKCFDAVPPDAVPRLQDAGVS